MLEIPKFGIAHDLHEKEMGIFHMPISLAKAKVCDLFEVRGLCWDTDLVREVFDREDAERILDIPTSSRNVEDGWLWKYDAKGNFTVCICYIAAFGEENGHPSKLWGMIWQLNIPLDIQNFLWRGCKGFLQTLEALATRKVFVLNQYVVFPKLEDEGSFFGWVLRWLPVLKAGDKALIAVVCWNLWINRNNHVWRNKTGSVESILAATSSQFAAWYVAHTSVAPLRSIGMVGGDGCIQWSPPNHGFLKAKIDAINFSRGAGTNIKIVVRDWNGNVVSSRQVHLLGSLSPRATEIIGVKEAALRKLLACLRDTQT
ncbi:uncharacterized protein LOC126657148 [Mercurialis annua]|uniref:uncharacterized protein LOC126657148 n=1 Tax=Mercurialis annua TaxID=3986 RepID=UPI00215FA41F|nr:uncharacterized protein LOC126657148 [Mercurialis annua]